MDQQFDLVTDSEALFRFLLVSRVRTVVGAGGGVTETVRQLSREVHLDFKGAQRTVGVRTLFRWLAAYDARGLPGLVRKIREATRSSTVLPEELLLFAKAEKEDDPQASVPELIKRARALGMVGEQTRIDRTTLYRALVRMGVSTKRKKTSASGHQRRFAWPHRMQMVLADGKYFRAGAKRQKRVAVFYLDDATRMGLEVVVGTSESTVIFLTGLHLVFRRYGKMSILFLDGGPGFVSGDTAAVAGNLGAHLIIGTASYPEGHGAVERFNRTAKKDLLRHLDGRPDVDPDPGALTLRIRHWLRTIYNRSPHEFLDGATPEERFLSDQTPLRLPESERDLSSRFFVTEQRKVAKDHVVPLFGVDYETPAGHAGTRVTLYRYLLEDTVHMLHQGLLVRLHPVDLAENARSRRARKTAELPPKGPTRGAADITFANDFKSVVDPDGGFTDFKTREEQS
jgi:putative transposase